MPLTGILAAWLAPMYRAIRNILDTKACNSG